MTTITTENIKKYRDFATIILQHTVLKVDNQI